MIRARVLPSVALVPVAAVVWWVAGFLPWIVDGLLRDRPSDSNLSWAAAPLISSYLGDLILYAGVGGVLAGMTVLLGRDGRVRSAGFVAAGVVLASLVVLAHARSVVDESDQRLVDGLTVIGFLAALLGLGVGLLAAARPIGVGIVLAVVAGSVPIWVANIRIASGNFDPGTGSAGRWIGAVVLVAALVAIGARPLTRCAWWPAAIAVAWFISPLVTAAGYFGTLLRPGVDAPGVLGESFSAGLDVWRMAASPEMRPLTPWIVAIVMAVGLVCAREVKMRAAT